MPSVSKSQQRLMGMAYAVKSGDMEISDIDPAYRDKVKSLSDGMTKKDLKKYASTKHDKLPETVDEAFIGPFVFNDRMSDEELLGMYKGALDGYANYAKGMYYSKSDYKRAYQEIEKILKKRGVAVDENFETSAGRIAPSNMGGMGPVLLPSDGVVGSGDVPSVADIDDDEEEAKKDKTKKKLEMEGFKLFTQFNNFVSESLVNEAFKFGKKNQYSIDDVNEAYGFWGTLELAGFKRREIEDNWHSAMAWLTESYKFSDAGALYYLNAKAGRWIADQVIEQKGNRDVVDVLEDYASPAQWKKWSKEYNKFAQEEMMTEAVARGTKIYCIATPAPKAILAGELEDLFGADYRHIVTEFEDDEGYESVLVFNLTKKDIQLIEDNIGDVLIWEYSIKKGKLINESLNESSVEDLHFETDPKKAEDMKIAIGKSQGEVTRAKQIEGGEYSLRRFRKEIKYDETGEDLGVFKPGSYMAATSKLGDGPHKKAVKKVRWNQKMYDQWIEDVASNDGWKNAFDMAQNAKHEPGLLQWAKKEFRGEDVMQRIQWDIEAYAESVEPITEKKEDRDAMMKWIEKSMDFVRTTEDFNGNEGGIWLSGENMDEYKGQVIYDYYSEDYKNREFGVLNKWEKELNKRGWYSEWYDAGTVMVWPL
jgi:hypothetical protein